MGKNSDDRLHTTIKKHLEIAKNGMLSVDVREESRQLSQYLVELVAFRKFYGKLKQERDKKK